MPRDGSIILSDVRSPTLEIVCEPCGRRGVYSVSRLMEQHGGDAKLTDLLHTLVDCHKARPTSVHDAASSGCHKLSGLQKQEIGFREKASA
jgi:hypothetical protein